MIKDFFNYLKSNPAVTLTVFSGLMYFFCFQFEMGYCFYFDIPISFIDVQVNTVLKFSIYTLLALSLMPLAVNSFILSFPLLTDDKMKKMLIQIFGFGLILSLFLMLNTNVSIKVYLVIWSITGLLLAFGIIISIIDVIRVKRAIKKLKSIEPEISQTDLKNKLHEKFKLDIVRPQKPFTDRIIEDLILYVAASFIFALIGYGVASKKESFEVFTSNNSRVIITKYGDNIICKSYNAKTKKIGDTITVIKFGYNKDLVLKEININTQK
ncbi:hypothetical protein SAMN05192574_10813 [Mucilaginibacter gossypiicola]|uniref:Uncharacterized protein n=1 Tax=Mucilaginibacter gossypiicola TaxID=551995 RepID=A0A1H8PIM5_9SPHI|nr:hypothetical protein [Mucilaginibacter gossypiicola]SEO41413.1 hypothetical protein SAMN05192574_10813 [Mucilaginibacter gossypiicola]